MTTARGVSRRGETTDSVTGRLAGHVVATRFEALPTEVVAAAKAVCCDAIGVMLAGGAEESGVADRIKRHVRALSPSGPCSVVTGGFRTDALSAAFANGVLAHVLDYEPMMVPLTHPTSPVLPPLLALAEWQGFSGRCVLEAFVAGFETQAVLRRAGHAQDLYRFHPPGVVGPLGAAAACANLLGLSPHQTCWALGIAGSWAGGLTANTGTMTKATHPANAGRLGLEAALLARLDWTAHEDILDAGRFAEFFFGEYDFGALYDYGNPWFLATPGVAFKRYPSQTYTHRAIEAALELRERLGPDRLAIDVVEIETTDGPVVDRRIPKDGLDGKFSVQYTVVVALLDGEVGIDSFTDERRFAPDVAALLPRVRVSFRAEIPSEILETHTLVRVRLADGRSETARCDTPRGYWGRPLPPEERAAKFRDCAARSLTDAAACKVFELVNTMDELGGVGELMDVLRTGAQA